MQKEMFLVRPHRCPRDEGRTPYVAVLDGVQIPRRSHNRPGMSWPKNPRTPPFMPGPHRAQRSLHLAALSPQTEGVTVGLSPTVETCLPREGSAAQRGTAPKEMGEGARLDPLAQDATRRGRWTLQR